MMKTVPPLNDLFNMAGLNLPNYLKGANDPEAPIVVPPVVIVPPANSNAGDQTAV
ncbi:hypothetical protein D3C87_2197310 [compost metagenome]